jgi:peptide chain release factor 1
MTFPTQKTEREEGDGEMSDHPIPDSALTISRWPVTPTGGQHVGISSGIRVEHLPSGLVAIVNNGRSQHQNKVIALDMILGGLTSPRFK